MGSRKNNLHKEGVKDKLKITKQTNKEIKERRGRRTVRSKQRDKRD